MATTKRERERLYNHSHHKIYLSVTKRTERQQPTNNVAVTNSFETKAAKLILKNKFIKIGTTGKNSGNLGYEIQPARLETEYSLS